MGGTELLKLHGLLANHEEAVCRMNAKGRLRKDMGLFANALQMAYNRLGKAHARQLKAVLSELGLPSHRLAAELLHAGFGFGAPQTRLAVVTVEPLFHGLVDQFVLAGHQPGPEAFIEPDHSFMFTPLKHRHPIRIDDRLPVFLRHKGRKGLLQRALGRLLEHCMGDAEGLLGQLRQLAQGDRSQATGQLAKTMQHQRAVQVLGGPQPWQGFLEELHGQKTRLQLGRNLQRPTYNLHPPLAKLGLTEVFTAVIDALGHVPGNARQEDRSRSPESRQLYGRI